MAPKPCEHSIRDNGVIRMEFARAEPDGPLYSATVSVGVCRECGQIELYAQLHHLLGESHYPLSKDQQNQRPRAKVFNTFAHPCHCFSRVAL